MSKNAIIGVLVTVVVIGGGIWLFHNPVSPTTGNLTTTTTSVNTTPVSPAPSSQPGVPLAETSTLVVPSNSTAVVIGKVTPNGAATSYWFEYGLTTDLGHTTSSQSIGSGFNSIGSPAFIAGLTSNTQYYFRLDAQNKYGTTHGATYSFTTNSIPASPAVAPTTQTNSATGVARTSVNINGHVNPNGSPTTYWFEYGDTNDLGSLTAFQSAGQGTISLAVSMSLLNLRPLTTYYFRLNAQNQFGTVNGAIQSFKTSGPAAPSQPTANTISATNVGTSAVTLRGQVNPDGADTDYWFEYSSNSLIGSVVGTLTPTVTLATGTSNVSVMSNISGLTRNTKYFYRLVAKNQYGTVTGDTVSFNTKS